MTNRFLDEFASYLLDDRVLFPSIGASIIALFVGFVCFFRGLFGYVHTFNKAD